jgi:hypothetical protein
MAQADNNTCEICMSEPGLHFCKQCDKVFCDDCKMSHLGANRNHIFLSGPNINTEKKVGCTDHGEDFIYLCENCDKLICRLCVTKAHKAHALLDIKDSNKEVQTEISKYLDSKVDNVRSSATVIEGTTKTYKTEVEATVRAIIEHGNTIKDMVDVKVDSLIKALIEKENIELKVLSKANKDCKDLLGEVTKQQQIYQDMIKQCDEVSLFQKMKKMKSDIEIVKSVDVTSLPSATYNRKNANFPDVEKMFGNLTFQ